MEGLAITPNGRMLVGAMQSPLAQDSGDLAGGVTRIVPFFAPQRFNRGDDTNDDDREHGRDHDRVRRP